MRKVILVLMSLTALISVCQDVPSKYLITLFGIAIYLGVYIKQKIRKRRSEIKFAA